MRREKRNDNIVVRVNGEELKEIDSLADAMGHTRSSLVRFLVREKVRANEDH
jgi:metal-responsive CopG/Arc/MetJ family transcriptional regulator